MTVDVLKVSSKSNPNSVAGALAGVARERGSVEVQVVGAGALNQAVKAIAIARGYMAPAGQDLMCRPTFADIRIDGESRTAIRLHIEVCPPGPSVAAAAPAAAPGSDAVAPDLDAVGLDAVVPGLDAVGLEAVVPGLDAVGLDAVALAGEGAAGVGLVDATGVDGQSHPPLDGRPSEG